MIARFMDLPLLQPDNDPNAGYVALSAKRWPSGGAIMVRSQTESGWQDNVSLSSSAIIGETLTEFKKGPMHIFDRANVLDIEIYGGALLSVEQTELFAG